MSRGLVIGEALIDIVQDGHRVAGEHVGGSPLNVAVGLARLGRDVDFLTHIGNDPYGERIAEYVNASGAQLVSGSQSAERTTTARLTVGEDGSANYEFDLDWQLSGTPPVAPPLFVHTGSIAAVHDPGCLAVAALVDAYRVSATVSFDPNVRPSLIADRELARHSHRASRRAQRHRQGQRGRPALARPGPPPGTDCPDLAVAGSRDRGGDDGRPGRRGHLRGRGGAGAGATVQVVDTVGAGDSFMVGLLDALWAQGLLGADRRAELAALDLEALTAALEAGSAAAAITVGRAGADLPDRDALAAAAQQR